jgi:hypothetical protein
MKKPSNKSQIQLALLAGTQPQRDWKPKSMKFFPTKEEFFFQHVLDLEVRGFLTRLATVKDMADSLLAERHCNPVGHNWAANFVKRQHELKVKFNQKYNYERALCNNPEA